MALLAVDLTFSLIVMMLKTDLTQLVDHLNQRSPLCICRNSTRMLSRASTHD